jgi:hypothetical protein
MGLALDLKIHTTLRAACKGCGILVGRLLPVGIDGVAGFLSPHLAVDQLDREDVVAVETAGRELRHQMLIGRARKPIGEARRSWPYFGCALSHRRGSVLSVILKRAHPEDMRAERSPGPLLTGLRVLCVDNEASILVAMKALLERWGVKVTAAGSSRAAAALNGAGM